MGRGVRYHTQKRREPSRPSSPSSYGIRGSIAERVRPQKRGGDKSFLVAVNFQPMCEPHVRHCAMVQAYLGGTRNKVTHNSGLCLHPRPTVLGFTLDPSWLQRTFQHSSHLHRSRERARLNRMSMSYPGNQLCSVEGLPIRLRLLAL